MLRLTKRLKFKTFTRCESGAVLLETILWIPFIFLFSVAIADTFFVYTKHAAAQMVLEDQTRLMIVGALPDCAALESELNTKITATIPSAQVSCSLASGNATVTMRLPAAEMGIGAIAGFVDFFELSASTVRTLEYYEGV